ncbi:uncharacterized protein LOC126902526 [Daktulosphaira vitifoliae]|uniref:uncharacterized protein LOC126902526 n=1 Tax=Daktulosphaira vitifoliae TaxID=58002 RepID=UPI0021AA6176|nr:uncharacterized protein LOC126902526 [Daktulosphaira vitifoliae]
MNISQILLDKPHYTLSTAITSISKYNDVVRRQISTLYGKDTIEIGALWLVNIYTSIISFLTGDSDKFKEISKNNLILFNSIKDTHAYIILKLIQEQDIENCYVYNAYCTTDKNLDECNDIDTVEPYILIQNNNKKIDQIIERYFGHTPFNINETVKFTKNSIYLRNIIRWNCIKRVTYFYLEQVEWPNMVAKFNELYNSAHTLNWSADNLQFIKFYLESVFEFLKIIMLRLTWKHFLYVQFQKSCFIEFFITQWILLINEFSTTLCLKDDVILELHDLMNHYANNIPKHNDGSIDEEQLPSYKEYHTNKLISFLTAKLNKACKYFGCVATKPMFLIRKELPGVLARP